MCCNNKGNRGLDEKIAFYDQVELVKSICDLGDRLNTCESEVAVTARTRVG